MGGVEVVVGLVVCLLACGCESWLSEQWGMDGWLGEERRSHLLYNLNFVWLSVVLVVCVCV